MVQPIMGIMTVDLMNYGFNNHFWSNFKYFELKNVRCNENW